MEARSTMLFWKTDLSLNAVINTAGASKYFHMLVSNSACKNKPKYVIIDRIYLYFCKIIESISKLLSLKGFVKIHLHLSKMRLYITNVQLIRTMA